ncbi:MAG: DsbE family thiol:disulfide interchange protein [Acetobacteraceae bacterium]
MNRRVLLLAPLGVAAVAGAGFWSILSRMKAGRFDPHDVPSQLIDRAVPDFAALPGLDPSVGFGSADLLAGGKPVLVNFFASWCVPCIIEAPALMALSREGMPIWGIAYKDKPEAARGFLARHGDPYARIARDDPGRVAIEWGVYGVPETYLLDRNGVVRWRQAGPLTPEVVAGQLRPALRALA